MRYISFYDEFALHNRNGNVRHKFWQGELIVGDPTTKIGTGNAIDTAVNADDPGLELMPLVPTGANRDAICGMGTLNPLAVGQYYESPYLPVGDTSVPAVAGLVYKVISGNVTYKGITYVTGQEFTTDGTIVATTGTAGAKFAITIPPAIKAREMDNRGAMFREKHLLTGNEATGYHSWTALGGFLPKDDLSNPLNPADTTIGTNTGFGYIDN